MSDGDMPTVQFRTSNTQSGAPYSPHFSQYLQAGLLGGGITYEFFAGNMGALHDIAQTIANGGDGAWQLTQQASSLGYDFLEPNTPAHYVQAARGTLIVQVQTSTSVLQETTTDYKEAGIATVYLVTSAGPVDVMISSIEKLGPSIAAVALGPALMTILGAFKTFVQSFVTKAFSAASEGATDASAVAGEAAEEAAGDAAIEGEVLADEVAISLTFSPLAIAGIVVAVIALVLAIILFFLAKTMTGIVKFYNASDQQIVLSLCYGYDLALKQTPQTGILPGMSLPPAPPGVKPLEQVIYRADYMFQNDTSVEGIGIVLQAGEANDFPGLTFMIDIPSVGDNSMYVALSAQADCEEVYSTQSGQFTTLTQSTSAGAYTLSVATNQVSGESQSPITGESGYFYEYLVVLSKQGA